MPSMAPEWGGPVSVAMGLTPALAQLGVECEIAAACGHRVGDVAAAPPDTPVHAFRTDWPGRWWTGYSRELRRFLDSETGRFDLVHVHEIWNYGGYAATRAARNCGKPYVVSVHGELHEWPLSQKRAKKWVYYNAVQRRLLQSADAIHALGKAEAERIAALGIGAPVFVVPNGVPPELPRQADAADPSRLLRRWPQLAGKRVALFLGRLHAKKGLDVLARAFAEVADESQAAALLVAGPDEDGSGASAAAYLDSAGLSERAVFTGMLTGQDKLAAFAVSHVFALPSHSEGQSVAPLEAMAARLPIVLSEGCNFPEAADAGAGYVVANGVAPLANTLRELLADDALSSRMGANARRMIEERHTWPVVAADMADAYRNVLAGSKASVKSGTR